MSKILSAKLLVGLCGRVAGETDLWMFSDDDLYTLARHGIVEIEEEQERSSPDTKKIGSKEGDVCGLNGCTGRMAIKPTENCSCHIDPPCSACVEAPIYCPECLREIAWQPRTDPKQEQARTCETCRFTGSPLYCVPEHCANGELWQPRPDPVDSNPEAKVETAIRGCSECKFQKTDSNYPPCCHCHAYEFMQFVRMDSSKPAPTVEPSGLCGDPQDCQGCGLCTDESRNDPVTKEECARFKPATTVEECWPIVEEDGVLFCRDTEGFYVQSHARKAAFRGYKFSNGQVWSTLWMFRDKDSGYLCNSGGLGATAEHAVAVLMEVKR